MAEHLTGTAPDAPDTEPSLHEPEYEGPEGEGEHPDLSLTPGELAAAKAHLAGDTSTPIPDAKRGPDVFVKFASTTTSAHDDMMSASVEDGDRRRAQADAERATARAKGLGNDPNEVASQHTNLFTDHPEVEEGKVHLLYISRFGTEVEYEGIGDIVIPDEPAFEGERMLMLFCPRCLERYPAAHCIIQVRQSNRFWALDEKTTGDPFVFEGEHYVSAGMIMDSEEFTCGRCSWAAKIDKNRVRPR